ncbi:VapC toxin family PIN domain ribonuclease [bacterium (Candidatus Blackallbacteria) CG17_big_fil_post_rev_8_21_14_2_50_48_46]|uniref:Ribonuclease VapC n=1 Tax=bacterium (Candidatus Blackallbacteria) CG17_big_fil_post_rev_8_21_14_2_50_48_46 TaxID=2014261 RepID=A0A2M7G6I4_9BACT|nr:MAG: VapC toxin family PIN domain ribonuclease [bacterium (Candidatus Blackallbacteria) CG18_big_fil_WC_8_21_14_2_50_49_26]PIW17647.1 MAG: VapC toxin family PIN domain ribonuclease [bacterium (Candidatus Blackallbacteria) CG17_big_fil_post_rev_8_21_14_2_50_48_46]PIW49301.1 MAG: VapC toxin family PIN domain ribonuclease [bacterium (Candidatus Blackallbacteria) CG13_big_fil_rev_8_21_14_2_50_49_14]
MWLLDTNIWIQYLSPQANPLHQKIAHLDPKQLRLCDIVKAELLYGAYKSERVQQNLEKLEQLFKLVDSFPFDGEAARHFGDIRAHLAKQATPIGPYDLQIAAIARANQMILVTHNTREFSRVPGLQIEDWLEEP